MAISPSRPTRWVSWTGVLRPTACTAATRAASQAITGSALPFRRSGSSSSYSTTLLVARMVRWPTVTLPGRAALWRREATFTVSPVTV